jgi:hypothetical protein
MAGHTYPVPNGTVLNIAGKQTTINVGDTILLVFSEPVGFTYQQSPTSPPAPAFSPPIPSGSFLENNLIGPYTAVTPCSVTFTDVDNAGNSDSFTIKIQ